MKNGRLISVVIPVYNAEETIEKCVKAVLNSDYDSLEIILVDDGSKDSSLKICEKLQSEHSNVHVYHYENAGAAAARNRGIHHANGEFIAFIDSDDLITSDYFTVLYANAEKNNSDVSVCGYKKIYGESAYNETLNSLLSGSYDETPLTNDTFIYDTEDAVKNLLYQRNFISSPWAMISKKSLWNEIQFPEGKRAEDVATIYRLFAKAKKVSYVDAKLYLYYQSKQSTIYTTQSVLNPDYYSNCIDMVNFIQANMPSALHAAKSRLFSACFQILSETKMSSGNKVFIRKLYKTIKDIRLDILSDKNGKTRNRCAALLSFLGTPVLHLLLRIYYKLKTSLI